MKFRVIVSVLVLSVLLQNPVFAVTVRDVAYTTKSAGKVVFSHRDHINKKGLANNCRACHDALFDLKKKKHFSMADMRSGASCGACHDGKKAFTIDDCARCHQTKEIQYKVKATGPTGFSHKLHLAVSADCSRCHPSIFAAGPNKRVTMAEMEKGKSCGACHNGTKASGLGTCTTCHPVQEITYHVEATGPTHFSHKIHLEVAGCGECHPKLYSLNQKNRRVGMAAMEKGKSCGACHNSKKAFSVKECLKCHPARDLEFEDKTVGNAVFKHTFHTTLYTCGDCHISLYKTARSKTKVSMREMEEEKSCGRCHDGKTAFSVKDKCGTCHKI